MTFGEQNCVAQSFRLLDEALDSGINFFDSAEMYPVPQLAATQGRSEEYLGRWIRDRNISRSRLVLATKVAGPSGQMTWIRGGPKSLDAHNIAHAIDNSLLRLQTDYIDVYQIHWPDRRSERSLVPLVLRAGPAYHLVCRFLLDCFMYNSSYVPMFGETEYDPTRQFSSVPIEEQLSALGRAVSAGKIRYIGLSNESPYGLMKFLQVAKEIPGHPKIVSVQNSYNLLCRSFDSGLAECCHHEGIFLLAYSPLAMGILSGKYFSSCGGPLDSRMNLFRGKYSEGESRYNLSNPLIKASTKEYVDIAKKYALPPAALAIAFVLKHPLVATTIFGATKSWQLQEVVRACEVKLTPEIIAEIDAVHARYPNPCP